MYIMDAFDAIGSSIVTASRLLDSLRNVGQRFKRLDCVRIEVLALSEILVTMSKHQENPSEGWRVYTPLFLSCGETMQEILFEVERIMILGNSRMRQHFYMLKASDRLDDLITQLDRHKSTFAVILSGLMR